MKKLFAIAMIAAAIVAGAGCSSVFDSHQIEASKVVTTKAVSVANVDCVVADDQLDVVVEQGPFSAVISGPENIVPMVTVNCNNGILTAGMDTKHSGIRYPKGVEAVKLTVTLPTVKSLKAEGQSSLVANAISAKGTLKVTAEDQSSLYIKSITGANALVLQGEDQASLNVGNASADAIMIEGEDQSAVSVKQITAGAATVTSSDQASVGIDFANTQALTTKATDQSSINVGGHTGTVNQTTTDQASTRIK